MIIKIGQVFKIARLCQDLLKREKKKEISRLSPEIMIAEYPQGLWASFKYLKLDGTEDIGNIFISDDKII